MVFLIHYHPTPPKPTQHHPTPPNTTQHYPTPPKPTQHHPTPPHTSQHHPTPPNTTQHHPTPPNTTQHHPTPPNTTQTHPTPPNTTPYHPTPPNTTQHHPTPPNTTQHHPTPPNTAQSHSPNAPTQSMTPNSIKLTCPMETKQLCSLFTRYANDWSLIGPSLVTYLVVTEEMWFEIIESNPNVSSKLVCCAINCTSKVYFVSYQYQSVVFNGPLKT